MIRDYVITTVQTAASSLNLTDLATVKSELSLPTSDTGNDAWLNRAITQASTFAASYCNRIFPVQTYQDIVRRSHRSGWHNNEPQPLVTKYKPLVSVAWLTEGTTDLVEDTDYEVDLETGFIYRIGFVGSAWVGRRGWEGGDVTIVYEAGFETIPADLVDACLRLVSMRFKGRDRDPMLRERTDGPRGHEAYWVNGGLPVEISEILNKYRIPVLG